MKFPDGIAPLLDAGLAKALFQSALTRGRRASPQRKLFPIALVCLAVTFAAASAMAEDEGSWRGRGYIDVGGGYKTGDFGSSTRSNLYYLQPTLGYVSPSWDVSITVPYLFLTVGNGIQGDSIDETSNMAHGIGDIIVRAGKVIVPEGKAGFSMRGSLSLKLPTAPELKGLGTGKTDFGGFAGLYQRVGRIRFSLFGGYIKVGDYADFDYQDTPLYGAGLSGIFGRTSISASIEGRRSIVPGFADPKEIYFGVFHVLSRNVALRGGTFFGLNDGGPDFGLEIGAIRWF